MHLFAHVSLILAPGWSKLSKHHRATSVGQVDPAATCGCTTSPWQKWSPLLSDDDKLGKKFKADRTASGSLWMVFKQADQKDTMLMILGTIGCVADASSMALIMALLSKLMNSYADSASFNLQVINKWEIGYGWHPCIVNVDHSWDSIWQAFSREDAPFLCKYWWNSGANVGEDQISLGSALINVKHFAVANVASSRIFEMIQRVPFIESADEQGKTMLDVKGEMEFKNIHFAYPSRPGSLVLQRFSLAVKACQIVGLVGKNGSGKSTIVNLIERFYDPLMGEILLDGINIKEFQLKWLRS
ncbi:hypothetical protein PTKIN_Ptkin11bG0118600 [Pterospermum kingtungense]